MNTQPLKEIRFYIVNPSLVDDFSNEISDEEFITLAEKYGDIHSFQSFQIAFNYGEISNECFLRIIEREYYL